MAQREGSYAVGPAQEHLVERVVTDNSCRVRDILSSPRSRGWRGSPTTPGWPKTWEPDRLDLVEIAMSCEERFDIDIRTTSRSGWRPAATAVRFVQAQVTDQAP